MRIKTFLLIIICINFYVGSSVGSTQDDLRMLKKFKKEMELKMIKQEALRSLQDAPDDKLESNKVFKGGQTAQQALNPEISIVSDFYGRSSLNTDHSQSGFFFRTAGFHFQSDLDPFSKAFLATSMSPNGVELGEGFIDYHKFKNLTVRIGKFLQNFGVINRWHLPSMDQWDNPLAPSILFGGKLNQSGISLHWMMPSLIASTNELFVEITNTDNTALFGTDRNPFPSALVRLVNFYDLSDSSYLNVGFTALMGKNNHDRTESDRLTKVYGLDLTFLYEPVGQARYNSIQWRTELFIVDNEQRIAAKKRVINAYGLYSYVEAKVSDRVSVGFRYDYVSPMTWASQGKYINQYVPYITFFQSPWVRTRLQLNLKKEHMNVKTEKNLMLQMTWAIGPHKHERY